MYKDKSVKKLLPLVIAIVLIFILQTSIVFASGGGGGGGGGNVCEVSGRCGPTNLVIGYCAIGCQAAQNSGDFNTNQSTYNNQCYSIGGYGDTCFYPQKACGQQPSNVGLCVIYPYSNLASGQPDCNGMAHLAQYDKTCGKYGICCSTLATVLQSPTPSPIPPDCVLKYNGFCIPNSLSCSDRSIANPNADPYISQYPLQQLPGSSGNCGTGQICCVPSPCSNPKGQCLSQTQGAPYCCGAGNECTSAPQPIKGGPIPVGPGMGVCSACGQVNQPCQTANDCCQGSTSSILYCDPNQKKCANTIPRGSNGCMNVGNGFGIPGNATNCSQIGDMCTGDGVCQPQNGATCPDGNAIHCFQSQGQICVAGQCVFAISPPIGNLNNPCPNNSCDTAIGTINVASGTDFVKSLFRIILSLAGGIALMLIIYSGYSLSLSRGNPEKAQGAKETLTSAIIGLVFIILSLTILQIIGVDVLQLPGFKP